MRFFERPRRCGTPVFHMWKHFRLFENIFEKKSSGIPKCESYEGRKVRLTGMPKCMKTQYPIKHSFTASYAISDGTNGFYGPKNIVAEIVMSFGSLVAKLWAKMCEFYQIPLSHLHTTDIENLLIICSLHRLVAFV